jgi:hypothetical protein
MNKTIVRGCRLEHHSGVAAIKKLRLPVGGITHPVAATVRSTHISAGRRQKPKNPYAHYDRFTDNNPFVLQTLPDRDKLTPSGGHGRTAIFSLQGIVN